MGTSLTSFGDGLHYTWPLTSVLLVLSAMAPSKAITTPSVLGRAVHIFLRVLKATNFIHRLYIYSRYSQAPPFEFLPL